MQQLPNVHGVVVRYRVHFTDFTKVVVSTWLRVPRLTDRVSVRLVTRPVPSSMTMSALSSMEMVLANASYGDFFPRRAARSLIMDSRIRAACLGSVVWFQLSTARSDC